MHNPFKDFSHINPQREDGHRQIENSVYHALMLAGFSGAEYQVLLCVIDRTWGFNKLEDMIPMAQFETSTGLDRRYISRVLHDLEEAHIVLPQRIKQGGRGHGNTYMFNKHWDTWINPETKERLIPSQPLQSTTPSQPLASDSAAPSTFTETPTPGQPLGSKGDLQSTIGKGDVLSTFSAGKVDKSEGKVDAHAQGKVDAQSPSKERYKERSKENIPIKERYGSFKNVHLPPDEYKKLLERFGEAGAIDRIEELSLYIKSKGVEQKYKDHYATILAWERRDAKEKEKGGGYGSGKPGSAGRGTDAHRTGSEVGPEYPFRAIRSGGDTSPDD